MRTFYQLCCSECDFSVLENEDGFFDSVVGAEEGKECPNCLEWNENHPDEKCKVGKLGITEYEPDEGE